jgi:hypothetical protein
VLVLAVVEALLRAQSLADSRPGIDYYQFWVVAGALERGTASHYLDGDAAAGLDRRLPSAATERRHFLAASLRRTFSGTGSPVLNAAIALGHSGDYDRDYLRFQLLSSVALVAGVLVCAHTVGCPLPLTLALIVVVVVAGQPFVADVLVGNVNRLQLLGLATVGWLLGHRRPWSDMGGAAALGALVLFKPNVGLAVPSLALWLLVTRQGARLPRMLAAGAVTMMALVLATGVWYGRLDLWSEWPLKVRAIDLDAMNLRGNLGWVGRTGATAVVSLLTSAALLAGFGWCVARGRPGRGGETVALVNGVLVFLLVAPLVWPHYLLLATPALILALRAPDVGSNLLGLVALVAYATRSLATGPGDGTWLPVILSNVGTLLLLATTWKEAAQRASDDAHPPA